MWGWAKGGGGTGGRGEGRKAAGMVGSASFPLEPRSFLQGNFVMQSNLLSKLHVGIIMDGNGRWATRRKLPRLRGHEAGVEAVRRVVEAAPEQGIGTLTLYAFSCDNWRRPTTEVAALMALMRSYLRRETKTLVRN